MSSDRAHHRSHRQAGHRSVLRHPLRGALFVSGLARWVNSLKNRVRLLITIAALACFASGLFLLGVPGLWHLVSNGFVVPSAWVPILFVVGVLLLWFSFGVVVSGVVAFFAQFGANRAVLVGQHVADGLGRSGNEDWRAAGQVVSNVLGLDRRYLCRKCYHSSLGEDAPCPHCGAQRGFVIEGTAE